MDWFDRLVSNRHIEAVILTNNQGQLLRSSRALEDEDDVLPSMLQALEVLAQTLTAEFGCGEARMVHMATEMGHLMLFPLLDSTYYLVMLTGRSAPLSLLKVELDRTLRKLTPDDLTVFGKPALLLDETGDEEAQEIIEAVQDWLRGRAANSN